MPRSLSDTISLSMIFAGFEHVGPWWNYQNVISPFYRLLYIEEGEARVYIDRTVYELTPGTLFLIPKFAFHRYECSEYMNHYYILFFDDLISPHGGIPRPSKMRVKVDALPHDEAHVKRYLELNRSRQLPSPSPHRYDNNQVLYAISNRETDLSMSDAMESRGILLELFARFVTQECLQRTDTAAGTYDKVDDTVNYIVSHLSDILTVAGLADRACFSVDHFSRSFKRVMGVSPLEYIQIKRIERAQTLLLTTDYSLAEVAELVGIPNRSHFSRLFTKLTRCSPTAYRMHHLEF